MDLAASAPPVPERSARLLARFGVIAVAAVSAFLWAYHYRIWLRSTGAPGGVLEQSIDPIVDGTAAAPFQYRFLVPHVIDWLRDTGISTYEATVLVDLVCLAVGGVLGIKAMLRAERGWALGAAAGLLALIAIGSAWFPKPETYPSYAVYAGATWALVAGRRWPVALLAVPLCFMRTDLVLCLGLSVLAAGWAGRSRRDVLFGAGIVALSAVATIGLILYFDASYDDDVFQVDFNLRPEVVLVGLGLLAVPLAPLLVARGWSPLRSERGRLALALVVPLLALFAVTALIGRLDEVRLFLPLVWSVALGSLLLWEAVLEPADAVADPA